MKILVTFLVLAFLFTSCFEEDEMVEPHKTGDLKVGKVELTESYKFQVFYDLESNTEISKNLISEWDLGFETSDSGWHIVLNTSKMMLAGNTMQTNFESVTSKSELEMNFDSSVGDLDSTAIGNWYWLDDEDPVSYKYVYVIDRGTDENYKLLGEKKITFDFQNNDSYLIRFANLDGSDEQSAMIPRDTLVNFVCFSFENGIVDIEPHKNNWDLQFGKYSTLLYTDEGDPYPYLVTGVLLNPFNTFAQIDTLHQFSEISLTQAETQQIDFQKDAIGYEWKEYDFDNAVYTVLPEKSYVLKNRIGFYYKLRFIDYYNSTGERGYPTFEFLRL